jgi:uncharacterized coiled-coil protein SlyX
MHWFPKHGKSMDTFRADVKKLLEGTVAASPSPKYSIIVRKKDGSQQGAYFGLTQAVKDIVDKNPGYTAYDKTGAVVYPAPPSPDAANLAARLDEVLGENYDLQRDNADLRQTVAEQAERIGALNKLVADQNTKLAQINKLSAGA